MNRASISRLTTTGTINAAALEIIAGLTRGLWVRSIEIGITAATASIYAVGRPAAKGVTPTSPLAFPILDSDRELTIATTALAWGTPPTVPASFYKASSFPAVIGSGANQQFGNLWVPAGGTLVLWNLAGNSVAYVSIAIDEEE